MRGQDILYISRSEESIDELAVSGKEPIDKRQLVRIRCTVPAVPWIRGEGWVRNRIISWSIKIERTSSRVSFFFFRSSPLTRSPFSDALEMRL